jgi:mRNA export factor
MLPPNT